MDMKLTKWERTFLNYYLTHYNAKWMRVFNNKSILLETRVDLYSIYKRMLKNQPITGQTTYINMFRQLEEGKWYFIPDLLNDYNKKEENIIA